MSDREKVIKNLQVVHNYLKSFENTAKMGEWVADALELLKEQEAVEPVFEQNEMVKPTKCPCGELFDAKDSSFCPKCGCAYGELSGRYTNIGR